jgi:IS5 family transposase
MLRTVADQPSLWEAILPDELRRLPEKLARVDTLLDDPVFFAPFVPLFDPRLGRPSTPMETNIRLMCLKFRYRLGYESLCREVSDSIKWRVFCRIGIDQSVPHTTTMMKLTTRCGSAAVDGLNGALLAKAVEEKVLRTTKIRVDTTVVPANVAYPTDSGLLARAVKRIATTAKRIQAAGGAVRTKLRDRSRAAGRKAHDLNAKLRTRNAAAKEEALAVVRRKNLELANLAETAAAEAEHLLANAKRALRGGQKEGGRLGREGRRGRRAAAWPAGQGDQRPHEAVGGDPTDRCADPAADGRHDPRRGDPPGESPRSGCPSDREGSAG